MSKAQLVLDIILLLQGTPLDDFARQNFAVDGSKAIVRCALESSLGTAAGETCKRSAATALRRYSYRFTMPQLSVLAELYVHALDHLEPGALVRVRSQMCNPDSKDSHRDSDAARAVCERVSQDF